MSDVMSSQECQCPCGETKFTLTAEPMVRLLCHCTICQAFNEKSYGDVAVFLSRDVCIEDKAKINFKQYQSPPAIDRGKCASCGAPAVEVLSLPLFPSLTIVPAQNIPAGGLPDPSMHIFYHRRVADIDDALPKASGFMKSQLTMVAKLLPKLLGRAFRSAKK